MPSVTARRCDDEARKGPLDIIIIVVEIRLINLNDAANISHL